MYYLISLLIAAIVSLAPAEAASANRTGPVVIAPTVIVAAKPKPKKTQPQPFLIIKMNEVQVTSY